MQNAKDTFFEVLRGRLAALNPDRTVAVRGAERPGVLVDENEMVASSPLPDCFHLRWVSGEVDGLGAMPLVTLGCEVWYATGGTALQGGFDRGRALAAMDAELMAAVQQVPQNAAKNDYRGLANGAGPTAMGTRVWWSDLAMGPVKVDRDRVTRMGTVTVMSYQEAGEL